MLSYGGDYNKEYRIYNLFHICAVKRRIKGPPAKGLLEIRRHRRQRHSSHDSESDEEWIATKRK